MLCSFCPRTIWATSVGFFRNHPESSVDTMYRVCEFKDQTLKKIRTLHFPDSIFNGVFFAGVCLSLLAFPSLRLLASVSICLRLWAARGALRKMATRAMRAMRENALETIPLQPYLGAQKAQSKYCQISTSKQRQL